MVLVAVFLTSSSFFLLTFTSLTPYLGMGMMGVAYSILVSALWPIAALMVTVSMQSHYQIENILKSGTRLPTWHRLRPYDSSPEPGCSTSNYGGWEGC